jgi:hypothetical protein
MGVAEGGARNEHQSEPQQRRALKSKAERSEA